MDFLEFHIFRAPFSAFPGFARFAVFFNYDPGIFLSRLCPSLDIHNHALHSPGKYNPRSFSSFWNAFLGGFFLLHLFRVTRGSRICAGTSPFARVHQAHHRFSFCTHLHIYNAIPDALVGVLIHENSALDVGMWNELRAAKIGVLGVILHWVNVRGFEGVKI